MVWIALHIVFMAVLWTALVAAGYVQWFQVAPWIAATAAVRPTIPDRREATSTQDIEGGGRWWHWVPSMILFGGACWAANLAVGNWWAAGGPPAAQPELYEQRGNLSCAVAVVFLLLAALLLIIDLRKVAGDRASLETGPRRRGPGG